MLRTGIQLGSTKVVPALLALLTPSMAALFTALKKNLRRDIPVRELDCNINDAPFAEACVAALLKNVAAKG